MAKKIKSKLGAIQSRFKAIQRTFGESTREHFIEKVKSFPGVKLTSGGKNISSISTDALSLLDEDEILDKLLEVIPTVGDILSDYSREKLQSAIIGTKKDITDREASKEAKIMQAKAIETYYTDKDEYAKLLEELYEYIGEKGTSTRTEIENKVDKGRDKEAQRLFDFIEHSGRIFNDADVAVASKEIKDYIKKRKSREDASTNALKDGSETVI